MSSISKYQNLALDWNPGNNSNKQFMLIVLIVTAITLTIALILSSTDLPEPKRLATAHVPDRIARFIVQKQKTRTIKPEPVLKPRPKAIPKPRLKKQKTKTPHQQKPLTKSQIKARKIAETSGLLALSNELKSLIDTDEVSAALGGKTINTSSASLKASTVNTEILTAGISTGSDGISSNQLITTNFSAARLTRAERTSVKQALLSKSTKTEKNTQDEGRSQSDKYRDDEDVTIVFDQNKSKLYSLYSRAKRKNPGLKGKIVFQLTIDASGKVISVSILSSELNDPALENSLLARIKRFDFGAISTDTLVVTYPIEFLPAY